MQICSWRSAVPAPRYWPRAHRNGTAQLPADRVGVGERAGAPAGCADLVLTAPCPPGGTDVIIPKRNEPDLDDLPDSVRFALDPPGERCRRRPRAGPGARPRHRLVRLPSGRLCPCVICAWRSVDRQDCLTILELLVGGHLVQVLRALLVHDPATARRPRPAQPAAAWSPAGHGCDRPPRVAVGPARRGRSIASARLPTSTDDKDTTQ